MNILGIETSCDETAAAVVRDGRYILANVVASQVDIHSRYGGIVPEVASRQHILSCIPILHSAIQQANLIFSDIDAIAVTNGPGLAGSLMVGVNLAKAISLAHRLPLIGVNHLEAHIYANWLQVNQTPYNEPELPAMCLIVSGGHTDIVLVKGHGEYDILGRTRDDAAGEAFDKVSRLLDLGYPGGPAIEKATAGIDSSLFNLPRAWLRGSYDFSFSGLKTAVLHIVRQQVKAEGKKSRVEIAAAFQQAVIDILVTKTILAARRNHIRQIHVVGGVAANTLLRRTFLKESPFPVIIPIPQLCTDNAAMVAACGYYRFNRGLTSDLSLDAVSNMTLT